jgi:hypothetical protein
LNYVLSVEGVNELANRFDLLDQRVQMPLFAKLKLIEINLYRVQVDAQLIDLINDLPRPGVDAIQILQNLLELPNPHDCGQQQQNNQRAKVENQFPAQHFIPHPYSELCR